MTLLTAIAVDDEPKALEVIALHASKVPFLELKMQFRDALEALTWLQDHPVDLLFLDINMPKLSGLKVRSVVGERPMIIFTTAYSEYALESYDLDAVDYLLKPIRFERFLKAVVKAGSRLPDRFGGVIPEKNISTAGSPSEEYIYVKSSAKLYRLKTEEILLLEKDGNYVTFYTLAMKIVSRLSMSQLMELLPPDKFLRVHKSYVISLDHVDVVEPHQVTIGAHKVPVAKSYREHLMARLKP